MSIVYQHIVIEGCIGAGKTTLSKMLAEDMSSRLLLEQFSENPFLPLFYKQPERYAFPVELFFMSDRHKQIQAHFSKPELFHQLTVSDYMFTKSLLFASQTLKDEELRLFQQLYKVLQKQVPSPDLIIYLHRPVEGLLKNIEKRGRDYESNISPEYLQSLSNAYLDYFKTLTSTPIWIVDGTELDFVSREKDYSRLKELLFEEHQPGIHYLSHSEG